MDDVTRLAKAMVEKAGGSTSEKIIAWLDRESAADAQAAPEWMGDDLNDLAEVIELHPAATCEGCIPWQSCRIHGTSFVNDEEVR